MISNEIINITTVKEAGAIFGANIATDFVELSNFKELQFQITSGAGSAGQTVVTVKGKLGEVGEAVNIAFQKKNESDEDFAEVTEDTLSIGGEEGSAGKAVYRITADMLAKAGFDRVNLNLTAVAESNVVGAIISVQRYPRYSDNN
jgi:glycerate-2-kinase